VFFSDIKPLTGFVRLVRHGMNRGRQRQLRSMVIHPLFRFCEEVKKGAGEGSSSWRAINGIRACVRIFEHGNTRTFFHLVMLILK
jgi:hypothetical protein